MGISPLNAAGLLAFTCLLALGQLLFKHVALHVQGLPPVETLLALLRQPAFYAAVTLYGTSTLLWIWILSRVPLTQAYPWTSLGVVLVPLLGLLVFGEYVRPVFWMGAGLIVAGVLLTQYGVTR